MAEDRIRAMEAQGAIDRRTFLRILAAGAGSTILCTAAPFTSGAAVGRRGRVIVLAFDGLDPKIVRVLMGTGRLPHFARLAAEGGFATIASTVPPQTPVAFSTILSGCDPGTHNIFDFIHRDPHPPDPMVVLPYFSMSAVSDPSAGLKLSLGRWRLPLRGGDVKRLRRGPQFWDYLTRRGAAVSIYDLPSTYPPPKREGSGRLHCMSGMGTPDLTGGYGEFTLFTSDEAEPGREVGGGRFVPLELESDVAVARIRGPRNFVLAPEEGGPAPSLESEIEISRDRVNDVARIRAGDETLILAGGEWSRWVRLRFNTGLPGGDLLGAVGIPTHIYGIVRFHLKAVHPHLRLYVSPVNIDPTHPVSPVSEPPDLSAKVARESGPFYTLGIPEDTKSLSNGALSEDEFIQQALSVVEERDANFRRVLPRFDHGCLVAYFGTSDLVQHMFWRDSDPGHPGRRPEQGDRYAGVIDDLYARLDTIVAAALADLRDEDTLIVLSDHGFASFRRQVALNRWLADEGYMRVRAASRGEVDDMFSGTDWSATRAYAMGINSLFINLRGREKRGIVAAGEKRALLDEIAAKLLELRDADGAAAVSRVDVVESCYPAADPKVAPDIIVGYAPNYRSSWGTALGASREPLFADNLDRWCGDHCIAQPHVPGVLITSRPLRCDAPALWDIAPTILDLFGVTVPAEMRGRPLFREA